MSKQDARNFTRLRRSEQEKIKPPIQDIVTHCFDGDMKSTILDFVQHIEGKNIPIKLGALNSWSARYKKTSLCDIKLEFDEHFEVQSWTVSPHLTHLTKYEETVAAENMQHIITGNLFICTLYPDRIYSGGGCHPSKKCPGGIDVTVTGKDIKGKCRHRPYPFVNDPGEAEIDIIKRLLELEMQARDRS